MKKVIFLHGALGCSIQLSSILKYLEEYFDIHTFDFTGHGMNNVYDGQLSIDLLTDDLARFITKNELTGADIFGYSMGGYIALNLTLNQPDKIGKIFTFATKFDWNPESALNESKMLNPQKILEKVPKFADELKELHGDKWERLVEQTSEMLLNLGSNPILTPEELSKIQNHVFISVGDKDPMVSIEESANAFRSLPKSRFTVFPATIHQITKIDVIRLRNELIEFLG